MRKGNILKVPDFELGFGDGEERKQQRDLLRVERRNWRWGEKESKRTNQGKKKERTEQRYSEREREREMW